MKILIIDDDMVYRTITSKMIAHINSSVIVEESENGEIGLSNLANQTDLGLRTVVFLDINMPVLNGWEFLEQIEKSNFYNFTQLEIYMVSSSTNERDILKAKDFDFIKGFIIKPLSKENLQGIIEG
jgi:CheY-like chemotaxis protein